MALTKTRQQYETLDQLFSEVYNRAAAAQSAVRLLRASWDGPVALSGIDLTQAQLDNREAKLVQDWATAKTQLILQVDAILGV